MLLFSASCKVSALSIEGPPEFTLLDDNQVNLLTGKRVISQKLIDIGSGDKTLQVNLTSFEDILQIYTDNFHGHISKYQYGISPASYSVSFGTNSNTFTVSNSQYVDEKRSGAKLEKTSSSEWKYTTPDGAEIYYSEDVSLPGASDYTFAGGNLTSAISQPLASAVKVVQPSGLIININHLSATVEGVRRSRIQSVTASNGLQLKYEYRSGTSRNNWLLPVKIYAVNNAYDYCNPTANSCALSNWSFAEVKWPTSIFTEGATVEVIEAEGESTKYIHGSFCKTGPCSSGSSLNYYRIAKIVNKTSASTVTNEYTYGNTYHCTGNGWLGSSNCVVYREGVVFGSKMEEADWTWTYSYSIPPFSYVPKQNNLSGPRGGVQVLINNMSGLPYRIYDNPNQRTIHLEDSGSNLVEKVEFKYGNSIEFDYDAIGNLTERREKPSSGTLDKISTASYSNNCNNSKTLRKPAWTEDAKGNRTTYTYHCASGNLATITKPADEDGVSPEIRYFYEQKYAYYKNSSGNIVRASTPIWLLTKESICKTGASSGNGCKTASDEVVTEYDYGKQQSGIANNLWLKGVTVTDKETNESRRTCYEYDKVGNKISETEPNANLSSCS